MNLLIQIHRILGIILPQPLATTHEQPLSLQLLSFFFNPLKSILIQSDVSSPPAHTIAALVFLFFAAP